MKRRNDFTRLIVMLGFAIALLPLTAMAQGGKVRMPDLSGLAEKASESVDISLDAEALKTAGSMFFPAGKGGPSEAQFAELVKGLQGVYVRVFEFNKPGEYSMRDIESVVRQVERDGWKKLLSVRDDEERVELWLRDDGADSGMFFIASEPDELVLINIVGKVNLEALSQLGGRMGMPNLSGILGGGGPPAPPARPARPAPTQPGQAPQQPAQPAPPGR